MQFGSELSQFVAAVANQAGALGVEVADVSGAIDQVSARVAGQAEAFGTMRDAAETMLDSNRKVAVAAGQAQAGAGQGPERKGGPPPVVGETPPGGPRLGG